MTQKSAQLTSSSLPQKVHSSLQLEEFLPYKLSVLASEISQAFAQLYGETYNLAIPEWRVIATLGQFGTITAKEICRHSRMHKTTVSRAVAALEKRKLIALRTNRDDMREVFLNLSEKGRTVYCEIVPIALHFEQTLYQDIPPEEKAIFERIMHQITARAGAHLVE